MVKKRVESGVYYFVLLLFVFMQRVCRKLELQGDMQWSLQFILYNLLVGVLCVIFVWGIVFFIRRIYGKFGKASSTKEKNKIKTGEASGAGSNLHVGLTFWLSWMAILLCYIPAFLAFYPGILAYDADIQVNQIVSGVYNNHHPLIHTLLIRLFMQIGTWIGNINTGVAIYTLFQMFCLSGAMAAGVAFLRMRGVQYKWLGLLAAYCGLFPTNVYLAISMTKDVFFAVFVVLFVYNLLYMETSNQKWNIIVDILYITNGVMLALFRNNGRYALLIFAAIVFLLFVLEIVRMKRCKKVDSKEDEMFPAVKRQGKVLLETVFCIVLSSVLLTCMDRITSAEQGDKREMLSIPIQQIARCMYYHGGSGCSERDDNSIKEKDKELINDFLLNNSYLLYQADIADPVKRNTNTYVVRYRTKEFLNTYLDLFLQFPGDYVNAFLAVNSGYLSVRDESHSKIYQGTSVRGLGYIQTRWDEKNLKNAGILFDSKWSSLYKKMEEFANDNTYLQIPFVRILVAPGGYFWGYLMMAVWILFHQNKKYLLPLFFVAGYYLTLLFGPTVQLRYLYPLMLLFPFLSIYFVKLNRTDHLATYEGAL